LDRQASFRLDFGLHLPFRLQVNRF
jgi:hypothetical protein